MNIIDFDFDTIQNEIYVLLEVEEDDETRSIYQIIDIKNFKNSKYSNDFALCSTIMVTKNNNKHVICLENK